MKDSKRH